MGLRSERLERHGNEGDMSPYETGARFAALLFALVLVALITVVW